MKNQKMYEEGDRMIQLIQDNYDVLQMLGRFGISLGFGDKTVKEVCSDNNVDCYTFLAIVNFTINGHKDIGAEQQLSIQTLLHYLEASHAYYLDFQLPFVRHELEGSLDMNDSLAILIMKLYDNYAQEIRKHMNYEAETVFPYVESILKGERTAHFDIDTFSRHHGQTDRSLRELKSIIIKYLPADPHHNNQLTATLYDIYNNESWLIQHGAVEDEIFIPAIRNLEKSMISDDVSARISQMINQKENDQQLSDREKDVIISLVQGMSNKEIANHLYISTNTVITHRRNIARKLQIHSPAGLTIYAIVNGLIDISQIKS